MRDEDLPEVEKVSVVSFSLEPFLPYLVSVLSVRLYTILSPADFSLFLNDLEDGNSVSGSEFIKTDLRIPNDDPGKLVPEDDVEYEPYLATGISGRAFALIIGDDGCGLESPAGLSNRLSFWK